MHPRRSVTTIGFDADDTLWHNERYFTMTQARFAALLAEHAEREGLMARLLEAERRNLPHYGFGIKGFTLSMIETAIEVTEGSVPSAVIAEILKAGREMLSHEVELLPQVTATLERLGKDHKLVLITKGDLLDQQRKLAESGLRHHFDAIEIVPGKTTEIYEDIFDRHGEGDARGLMVGDSMRSDVLPMIAAGGHGVHVPHGEPWEIERSPAPLNQTRFHEIEDLGALPDLIHRICAES